MEQSPGTVLITGACGNLGRAVANVFARNGRKLALLDREASQLIECFGPDTAVLQTFACDLTDAASVQRTVDEVAKALGPVTVLCNVAGGFRMGEAVHETSDQTWQFLMDLNVLSVLHTARAIVPGMLQAGGGAIVNVSAVSAKHGGAQMGAYAASKGAVARLTESMAAELRENAINVNCVMPSILDTPENRKDMPSVDPSRWVAPADLANVIVFLCSPTAAPIHGACLPVVGLS